MRRGPARAAATVALACALGLAGCSPSSPGEATADTATASTPPMTVSSTAFEDGGTIPARYTCAGEDVSPPLEWSGVPEDAIALAIVVTDPDARDFVHWVVGPLDPGTTGLAEDASVTTDAPQGPNDFGTTGWRGPCPPSGEHHYVIALYALGDPLTGDLTAASVEASRTVAVARLTATFAQP